MGRKNEVVTGEKGHIANGSKSKWRTALKVSSVLLLVLCLVELVLCALSALGLYAMFADDVLMAQLSEEGVDEGSLVLVLSVSLAIMVAESVLQAAAFVFGIRTLKGKSRAESCQVMGILLVGAAVVSSIATGLTSEFNSGLALSFVVSLVLPLVYYAAAHRIAKDTFWKGIKKSAPEQIGDTSENRELIFEKEAAEANRSFVLDGRVRAIDPAVKGDSLPAVNIVGLDEVPHLGSVRLESSAETHASIHHCHAELEEGRIIGTIALPCETFEQWPIESIASRVEAMFVLQEDGLTFATDDVFFLLLFNDYVDSQSFDKATPAAVLAEFLEFAIKDDMRYLIDLQERLDRLEENMSEDVNEIPKDFDDYVVGVRKTLRSLLRFYKQYADMCRVIAMTRGFEMKEADRSMFSVVADRGERLCADAQDLFDYALQIKNLYQSKIDVRQGKVMQILTIVTSIFMPLTLITGWYGMNFENMPELHWRFSYFGIIAIVVVVVTAEVVVFKRKKWF